jgi:electron transfer flavoprotein alpha subunit
VTTESFHGDAIAVVVCRDGRLPSGSDEAAAEAGGRVLVVGTGTPAIGEIAGASQVWLAESAVEPGALARALAELVGGVRVVIMPGSPDGRDLAPRLAAETGRTLLAGAVSVAVLDGSRVETKLLRVDGRVVVPVVSEEPVVATLMPGARSAASPPERASVGTLTLAGFDAGHVELVEPDPATMDLADARRVVGGGAGLVPQGATDEEARSVFDLLAAVARSLGASAGATRVVTDAGWMPYDRQIGTTGVAVDPDIYVALGVSGASQHVGGLGAPRHIASVNLDPSCPMTAMADLGVVADAPGVLVELAKLLGLEVPAEIAARSSSSKESNLA